MLGAAGALCCLTAGAALGGWMRIRRMERLNMLRAEVDMLNAIRLLLEQERLPLPELLHECAEHAHGGDGASLIAKRFQLTAQQLRRNPLDSAGECYAYACAQTLASWEQEDEKAAMESLFAQLGSGTAAMREQAAAACLRRLKPLCEKAQEEAEKGGRLCMQLGMLLGLMAGIVLW